jgi:hypothetical protein
MVDELGRFERINELMSGEKIGNKSSKFDIP